MVRCIDAEYIRVRADSQSHVAKMYKLESDACERQAECQESKHQNRVQKLEQTANNALANWTRATQMSEHEHERELRNMRAKCTESITEDIFQRELVWAQERDRHKEALAQAIAQGQLATNAARASLGPSPAELAAYEETKSELVDSRRLGA